MELIQANILHSVQDIINYRAHRPNMLYFVQSKQTPVFDYLSKTYYVARRYAWFISL